MPREEIDSDINLLINDEIEKAFLGALLALPELFDNVAWFRPEFFGIPVHGKIFETIKVHKQQGRDYCPDMIAQFFSNNEELGELGAQYLRDLSTNVISVSVQGIKGYANLLLSLHYRRMALGLSNDMRALAINSDLSTPPEALLNNLDMALTEARNFKTKDNIKSASEGVDAAIKMAKNPQYGIHSGFGALHKITGGFKPTQLITIGGRPGMGKTACGLTLAVNAAKSGKRVLFFSLEMSYEQLWARVLSRLAKAPVHSGNLQDDEWEAVDLVAYEASRLPIDIDDSTGLTALDICARANQYKRKNGLDMVIIDYLGFIKSADPKANKVHQIEEITGALKGLAKALQIPVILLCQLSRAIEGKDDKRPGLADLRDSGCIEQDSDMVMFIYREDYYADKKKSNFKGREESPYALADAEAVKGKAELIVAKNRQNVLGTINLHFSGERQEFYE